MKLFPQSELKAAFLFAESGGQALLPSSARQQKVGFLIDHDSERLFLTARRLGMRRVKFWRGGSAGQNVILDSKAFHRAVAECRAMELEFST